MCKMKKIDIIKGKNDQILVISGASGVGIGAPGVNPGGAYGGDVLIWGADSFKSA